MFPFPTTARKGRLASNPHSRTANREISPRRLPGVAAVVCADIPTGAPEEAPVFTLDSDFRIYRRLGNKSIPLLMPE